MKDFDTWNELKKSLAIGASNSYCKARDVWWCSLGVNIGFEQDGKHDLFERPVLVVKVFNKHVFWGIPLSTKLKVDNPHYLSLKHGDLEYSAIISQLRLYDTKRLQRKLYMVDKDQYALVVDRLKEELKKQRNSPIKKSDPTFVRSSEPEGIVPRTLAERGTKVNREQALSYYVNRELWSRMNILEQMGSIYPVFNRCLSTFQSGDKLAFYQNLELALDMFDATVEATSATAPHRIKEILAAKREFLRLFYIDNPKEEEDSLGRYFRWFQSAARADR